MRLAAFTHPREVRLWSQIDLGSNLGPLNFAKYKGDNIV